MKLLLPANISDLLLDSGRSQAAHPVTNLFRNGLENLLKTIIKILCADVVQRPMPPSGFTGRYRITFSNPTLGGLREFAYWLAKEDRDTAVAPLINYLRKDQKDGWIKKMVDLRNRWAHPKDIDPEIIISQAQELFSCMPDFASLGHFDIDSDGQPCWFSDGKTLPLAPFFWAVDKRLETFTKFVLPDRIVTREGDAPTQQIFAEIWYKLRQQDNALDQPTLDEFHHRIRKSSRSVNGTAPWWLKKVFRPGALALLTYPEVIDGVKANCQEVWPKASILDLELGKGDLPLELLAKRLGLGRPPSIEEFVSFADARHQMVIFLRAARITTKNLGYLLMWLADLRDAAGTETIRVFISREADKLKEDSNLLLDRLPDAVHELLRYPVGVHPKDLADCLWSLEKKSFFGFSNKRNSG